jgi:uncharacterized membrane protein HdeD (DUF308 family)
VPSVETTTPAAATLRTLYLVRGVFAVVWAALMVVKGPGLDPVQGILLVLYPVVDLVSLVVDAQSARTGRPAPALYVNIALSALAAVALALAAGAGLPAALRVWGVWAFASGATQLIVALSRRALGGQQALVLSGGLSVVAGVGFFLQAGTAGASLIGPAAYAAFGGILFIVSALRLRR